jgi:hypothetical protein
MRIAKCNKDGGRWLAHLDGSLVLKKYKSSGVGASRDRVSVAHRDSYMQAKSCIMLV